MTYTAFAAKIVSDRLSRPAVTTRMSALAVACMGDPVPLVPPEPLQRVVWRSFGRARVQAAGGAA